MWRRRFFGAPGTWLREPWFLGINAQGIGTIGMAMNFVVTLALTPFCAAPSPKVQAMIDEIREPEDESLAENVAVAEH